MMLKDKVAIVTGAGSGIGEGIALRFAKEGAKIVVAELDEEKGTATAAKIRDMKGKVLAVSTNVSRSQDVNAMVARALERFGTIDILVNNAGIRFAEADPEPVVWRAWVFAFLGASLAKLGSCVALFRGPYQL